MKKFPIISLVCLTLSYLLFNYQLFSKEPTSDAESEPSPKLEEIQKLELPKEGLDPTFMMLQGGRDEVSLLNDLAALEKIVGKDRAKTMAQNIDWKTQQIVMVSWSTGGPPEGTLEYEWKQDAKEKTLLFYVQGPVAKGVRGMAFRAGLDFYALARDLAVSFEKGER